MCVFVMATVPRDVDLNVLDAAIPAARKRRLMGRLYEHPDMSLFGLTEVENQAITSQLPGNDCLVRTTNSYFCDCSSTLVLSRSTCRKEVAARIAILAEMRQRAGRIGLLIHFGDPWSNTFIVRGPEVVSLSSPESLYGLQQDTYYEVFP